MHLNGCVNKVRDDEMVLYHSNRGPLLYRAKKFISSAGSSNSSDIVPMAIKTYYRHYEKYEKSTNFRQIEILQFIAFWSEISKK